jgi:hypothetical protein
MTDADRAYADWLNLLGSDEITDTDPGITADLHRMHDRAQDSHPSVWFAHGDGGLLHWCHGHRPAGLAVSPRPLSDFHPAADIRCVQCGRDLRP